MPRRPRPRSPLPPRDGLGAARVRMPGAGTRSAGSPAVPAWATVVAFLGERTGDKEGVWRRVRAGEVLLDDGTPVVADTPYLPGGAVHLYRDLPPEVEVPGRVEILLRDDDTGLLVVDKPPFLATMPRGAHVAQTVLVRLRRALDLPDLAPVHRLDRLTSGVLLLTTRREARTPYQRMVQAGGLTKTYLALAPLRPGLGLPLTVRDRLVKRRGHLQAAAEPGEPNAQTRVELDGVLPAGPPPAGTPPAGAGPGRDVGRYRLTPTTGQTHQLRVHLAGLGIPILGDPLYPDVLDVPPGDFSTPLQLLAQEVSFTDPVDGRPRVVRSRCELPISPP